MYGIYGDIIEATKKALECFDETQELLEYPEVQADKAYYLSILSKYNDLKALNDNLTALLSALEEENATVDMLAVASGDEERAMIYEEIYALKLKSAKMSSALSEALGCKGADERAYCRFKFKDISSKFGTQLVALIKSDLTSRGAKVEDENISTAKSGYVEEISFVVQGEDVLPRLTPLAGAHKVYISSANTQELRVAVTPSSAVDKIDENDLKIDVFHSHGAGGQNINKVETAVRVTHLPTGMVVVCQDERSQLKNKRRALETIQRRLKERSEQVEKKRIEADIAAQFGRKHTPISFDMASGTMTDTRLKAFAKVSFPLTQEQFNSYINGLMAL